MDNLENPRWPIPEPPKPLDVPLTLNEGGLAIMGRLPLYRDADTLFSLFSVPDVETLAGRVYLYVDPEDGCGQPLT